MTIPPGHRRLTSRGNHSGDLFSHLAGFLPKRFSRVDVFFVISGLLDPAASLYATDV